MFLKKYLKERKLIKASCDIYTVEQIVINLFIAGYKKAGDTVDFLYLKKNFKNLKLKNILNGHSELFSVESGLVSITKDVEKLQGVAKEWIVFNLRKIIIPPDYEASDPSLWLKRFITGSLYTPIQQQLLNDLIGFIDEFLNGSFDLNELLAAHLLFDNTYDIVIKLFSNFDIVSSLRNILTQVFNNELKLGDQISHLVPKINSLDLISKKCKLLFSYSDDEYYLSCDAFKNKDTLFMNALLLLIWEFHDRNAGKLLLNKIHIKFGFLN